MPTAYCYCHCLQPTTYNYMVRIRFQLDKPKSLVPTVIMVSVRYGKDSERIRFSVGESIEPNKWDSTRQRAKRGYRHEKHLSDWLGHVENTIRDAYHCLRYSENGIAKAVLRAEIDRRLHRKEAKELPTIWAAFDLHQEAHTATFAAGTLAEYRVIKQHLLAFDTAYSLRLSWDTITLPYLSKFADYLISVREVNNATLWKVFKHLRAFLRWIEENQAIPVNPDYKRFTRKSLPRGESSQKIYLTPEELERLWTLDLSNEERLQKVRDAFLFHCYTGLRYGDGQALRPEHYDRKGNFLRLVTGKNRKEILVPLHPRAKEVLERWEYRLPRITNQKFNDYLKELCQIIGMDSREIVVAYSGSKRIEKSVPRWELVGSHTAKRTAVTNLLLSGKVSLESICAVTGNSLKTIQRYIVPTSEDVRRQIALAWGEE